MERTVGASLLLFEPATFKNNKIFGTELSSKLPH
jgi:hypothetical protein